MIEETLADLISGLEADGYLIGADFHNTGYWVRFPDHQLPADCGLLRLRAALDKSPALKAGLLPYLAEHRPHDDLSDRAAKHHPNPRRDSVIAGW